MRCVLLPTLSSPACKYMLVCPETRFEPEADLGLAGELHLRVAHFRQSDLLPARQLAMIEALRLLPTTSKDSGTPPLEFID
jgi:hypothetical protein